MQPKSDFSPVDDNFQFSGRQKPYAPAPTKKPLKANITDITQTEQINNFKTTPDGKPNPLFGKPETMFVFKFQLNDESAGEANGQIYTKWVSGKVSERSGLGKISEALYDSPTAIQEYKAADIKGSPIQIVLVPGKKDPTKLVVDVDKLLPPTNDQVRLESDVSPGAGMTEAELEEVFAKA